MMNKLEHARYLGSIFVCVIASQATMVVDAAVGGNLLGADAVSVVELVMPVYELFYALTMLFGMGACTLASLALGRGDAAAVRRHFTGAAVSSLAAMLLLGAAISVFSCPLTEFLCGNSGLRGLTQRYLFAMVPYFIVAGELVIGIMFTAMSGRPVLVMCSALGQFAVNLSCNLLLIKGFGLGIEALAYSSLLSATAGVVILLSAYCHKDCPFRIMKCSLARLLGTIGGNIRYGSGFIAVTLAYMIMAYAMNRLVLAFQGENALFFWSVVMMIYLTGDYAFLAAGETSLMLGGRCLGAGDEAGAKMVYDRSLCFALAWIGAILVAVFVFPRLILPWFGAADAAGYHELIPVVMLAIPFIVGTSTTSLCLVRLVPKGKIGLYSMLSVVLFLAVPGLFGLFYLLRPGGEKYAFLALLPVQMLIILRARKKLS